MRKRIARGELVRLLRAGQLLFYAGNFPAQGLSTQLLISYPVCVIINAGQDTTNRDTHPKSRVLVVNLRNLLYHKISCPYFSAILLFIYTPFMR